MLAPFDGFTPIICPITADTLIIFKFTYYFCQHPVFFDRGELDYPVIDPGEFIGHFIFWFHKKKDNHPIRVIALLLFRLSCTKLLLPCDVTLNRNSAQNRHKNSASVTHGTCRIARFGSLCTYRTVL